ncbi:hypothetical protein GQ457_01G016970 [Hibiscus cannabinus]
MVNANFTARYSMIAAKNRWEEQGFFFDDSHVNYGLEQFVYNRLKELGWFRLARQPALANYNWVIEFYANNSAGGDHSTVRDRRVPTNATTINTILGLPDNEPSFYAMHGGFEEEDFELIKDYICEEGTAWNTTGRNPNSVSRLSLQPEAKLWNTFVKRNIMPTSHNQTVDRTRLLLIHTIITGYRINVGEILAKELTRETYMRKMDVADATPLNMAMPTPHVSPIHNAAAPTNEALPSAPTVLVEPQHTPAASPPVVPVSSHTTTSPATTPIARKRSRESTPDTPLGSTPISPPSPPAPAQSEEATPPIHILQLRSQLQRIEARQLNFQEETKVFNQSLVKFLCFQFPSAAAFFAQPSSAPPQPNLSAAAQPSTDTSAKAGATAEVHFSSDDENDVFDWQSPRDHLQPLSPTPPTPAMTVSILSVAPTPTTSAIAERPTPDSPARRKGKTTAGRSFGRDIPSSPEDEEAKQRPAKRQRRYHVITADSDDDSSAELHVPQPEKSDDPSLSNTF